MTNRAKPIEPADWQERHSPTIPVEVVTRTNEHGRHTVERGRMRKTDARLWNMLDTEQREAVAMIVRGAEFISGRMHRFRPQWARIASGHGEPEDRRGLEQRLHQWIAECQAEGVSTVPTLAVWRDGQALRATARQMRVDYRKARWHMVESLEVYCRMTGMKKRKGADDEKNERT